MFTYTILIDQAFLEKQKPCPNMDRVFTIRDNEMA